jgi:hypothetical protein
LDTGKNYFPLPNPRANVDIFCQTADYQIHGKLVRGIESTVGIRHNGLVQNWMKNMGPDGLAVPHFRVHTLLVFQQSVHQDDFLGEATPWSSLNKKYEKIRPELG